ncbi:nuclear transport factor 2 family protein [Dactylosporangium sp. NPDC051484]|uniref:nuclear transport factor 2 family protein n=1 Tax=Dactylosporangium sp. NPDC051484 TaxID=3154942 RepID=UPI00344CB623
MADDEITELRRRVAELEDERAVARTMVRYAESLDYGDSATWADTFTPDGVFDVRRRGEPMFVHTGTENLIAFADQHTSAPAVYHKHFLSVPSIVLDGDRAAASTYFTMLYERDTGPIVLVFGRYLDELTRYAGTWRFSRRIVDMEALPPG